MYKKLREPINSITHLAGAGLSLIALIAMLLKVTLSGGPAISILSVTKVIVVNKSFVFLTFEPSIVHEYINFFSSS